MKDFGPLLLPSLGTYILYSLVHVEARFLAPFLVVMALIVYTIVSYGREQGDARFLQSAALVNTVVVIGLLTVHPMLRNWALFKDRGQAPDAHAQVAKELIALGFRPGDRIAVIGTGINDYWAQIAGMRIVAEIPEANATEFWDARPSLREEVFGFLRSQGVSGIVSEVKLPCQSARQWTSLASGELYSLPLRREN